MKDGAVPTLKTETVYRPQPLVKMESLTAANTQFSLNLFKEISGGNASGNVFYSPVSISSALAMVSLGARGNTADQMIKVISNTHTKVKVD
ncbi:hypothetical protein PO909_008812 [Leuciscus waleckii]